MIDEVKDAVDKPPNEYEKSKVAGVLQYITHLIKYKDKHSMDHFKYVDNHKSPSTLEAKLRTMFQLGPGRLSDEERNLHHQFSLNIITQTAILCIQINSNFKKLRNEGCKILTRC